MAIWGEIPWILGGGIALITGIFLLIDDINDFGKIGGWRDDFFNPGQKTNQPIHHWMIGLAAIIAGILLITVGMVKAIATMRGRDNLTFWDLKKSFDKALK